MKLLGDFTNDGLAVDLGTTEGDESTATGGTEIEA